MTAMSRARELALKRLEGFRAHERECLAAIQALREDLLNVEKQLAHVRRDILKTEAEIGAEYVTRTQSGTLRGLPPAVAVERVIEAAGYLMSDEHLAEELKAGGIEYEPDRYIGDMRRAISASSQLRRYGKLVGLAKWSEVIDKITHAPPGSRPGDIVVLLDKSITAVDAFLHSLYEAGLIGPEEIA